MYSLHFSLDIVSVVARKANCCFQLLQQSHALAEAIVIDCRRLLCGICSFCEYLQHVSLAKLLPWVLQVKVVMQFVNQEKYNDMQYTEFICVYMYPNQGV